MKYAYPRQWTHGKEINRPPKKELDYASKAAQLWAYMDKNGQAGVRFGLFPAEVMEAAKTGGYGGHKLCCALMDVASKNGGMRA